MAKQNTFSSEGNGLFSSFWPRCIWLMWRQRQHKASSQSSRSNSHLSTQQVLCPSRITTRCQLKMFIYVLTSLIIAGSSISISILAKARNYRNTITIRENWKYLKKSDLSVSQLASQMNHCSFWVLFVRSWVGPNCIARLNLPLGSLTFFVNLIKNKQTKSFVSES